MIVIRTDRIQPEAGTGPRVNTRTYYFDHPIRDCWVGLTGYQLQYLNGDHEVQTISVELASAVRDTEFGRGVVVEGVLYLRDQNGADRFGGWADFILFVDLDDRNLPPVVVAPGPAVQ